MGISQKAYLHLLGKTEKTNKYHAKKSLVDGYLFDSKREARHYCLLKMLARAGMIKDLVLQPVFLLQPKFRDSTGRAVRAIKYVADFQYVQCSNSKVIVEDVKGFKTPSFKIKEKMFLLKYPEFIFRIV